MRGFTSRCTLCILIVLLHESIQRFDALWTVPLSCPRRPRTRGQSGSICFRCDAGLHCRVGRKVGEGVGGCHSDFLSSCLFGAHQLSKPCAVTYYAFYSAWFISIGCSGSLEETEEDCSVLRLFLQICSPCCHGFIYLYTDDLSGTFSDHIANTKPTVSWRFFHRCFSFK